MSNSNTFTHSLGFKLKKISLQNISPQLAAQVSSDCDTPRQSKKSPAYSPFPQIVRTMKSLSPGNTHSKPSSIQLPSTASLATEIMSLTQKGEKKFNFRMTNTKFHEVSSRGNQLIEDPLENVLMTTMRRENRTMVSPSPVNFLKENTQREQEKQKNRAMETVLENKTNEFIIASTGQILRRIPIKDQWFCHIQSGINNQTPGKNKSKTPKNQFGTHFEKKFLDKNDAGSLKFILFNKGVPSPKKVNTPHESPTLGGVKFLKVRTEIIENWGESSEKRESLAGENVEIDQTPLKNFKEKPRSKSQIKLAFKKTTSSPGRQGKVVERMSRRREDERKDELSPATEYNWLDKYKTEINRRNTNKSRIKFRRTRAEDSELFTNLSLRYTSQMTLRFRQDSPKKASIRDEGERTNTFKTLEVGILNSDDFINESKKNMQIMVEEY